MYGLISMLIGGLIAIMILFNGEMSRGLGNGMALVLIHGTGLLTVILVLLSKRWKEGRLLPTDFSEKGGWRTVPWYLFSAGAVGILVVVFNNVSFLNIGMSLTLALGLFGQSVTALVFDHFGFFGMAKVPFLKKKWVGLALIFTGIVIMTVWK